jgi:hypothetical protein
VKVIASLKVLVCKFEGLGLKLKENAALSNVVVKFGQFCHKVTGSHNQCTIFRTWESLSSNCMDFLFFYFFEINSCVDI